MTTTATNSKAAAKKTTKKAAASSAKKKKEPSTSNEMSAAAKGELKRDKEEEEEEDEESVASSEMYSSEEEDEYDYRDDPNYPMDNIEYPGRHDVLLGRGGETNNHSGNIAFRRMIDKYKAAYQSVSRLSKPELARELVIKWRNLDPPGRFLTKSDPSNKDSPWQDIGDAGARKKVSKSLGEKGKQNRRK